MKKSFAVAVALCLALAAGAAFAAEEPAAIAERCVAAMENIDSFAVKGTLAQGIEGLTSISVADVLSAQVFTHPFKARVLFAWKGWEMEAYAREPVEWPVLPEGLRAERARLADGKEAWRLSADVNLRDFVSDEDIEEAVGRALLPSARDVFPRYEPVPARIDAFVDAQQDLLLRVEIDLSAFLSDMLTRTSPSLPGMESEAMAGHMTLTLDLGDWNAVPDFEVPAEAMAR